LNGSQRGLIWWCDARWCPYYDHKGQLGFFDWYERWLDASLLAATK
jgi:hypothetical protein